MLVYVCGWEARTLLNWIFFAVLAIVAAGVVTSATARQPEAAPTELSEAIKKIADANGTSICLHDNRIYSEGAVIKLSPNADRVPPGQVCRNWKWQACKIRPDSNGNPTGSMDCPEK